MAKIAKSSRNDKQKKSSSDADPSAATSGRNANKRLDMKKVAQWAAENLKWWHDHPEAVEARDRAEFERELSIKPFRAPKKEGDDQS